MTTEREARRVWEEYCKSGLKPDDIPDRPDLVYADQWTGWFDWLGWNADAEIYAAIDKGGGQTCNVKGVLRELDKAGYVIRRKEK